MLEPQCQRRQKDGLLLGKAASQLPPGYLTEEFLFETNLSNAPTPSDERVYAYGVPGSGWFENRASLAYISPVRNGVIVKDASSLAIGVYGNWGLLMNQATQASVGTDPWTVVQNKLHPAVAEAEFTPLDWSYLSRRNLTNESS
jgi:hypothetical protein